MKTQIVDKNQNGPRKIGVGTAEQEPTLKALGADPVWKPEALNLMWGDWKLLRRSFLPGDVVVFLQADFLTARQLERLLDIDLMLMVPGHEPQRPEGMAEIRAFRDLQSNLDYERAELRGAKRRYPVPSPEQRQKIIDWWHSKGEDKRTPPRYVVQRVSAELRVEVPYSWVRDFVAKHHGHSRRDP